MSAVMDKFGAIGAILAAASCPVCFPLLAVVGSALGLGIFAPWEGYALYALQGFVLLGLIGNVLSFRAHRTTGPLLLGIAATAAVFVALYVWFNPVLIYAGLLGLAGTAVWNVVARRRCVACAPSTLKSVITCPQCGFQKEEAMPTDACQHFYECPHCKTLLKPKVGDCCVFCSYGTVKCPPMQNRPQC
jgi:hypothetical protein